jgi:GH24 family phage-related lysozyme (muramidase)
MPTIKALCDAGLGTDTTAASADSYVPAGRSIAITWIERLPGGNLARLHLAGRYTGPPGCTPLPGGSERFVNPARFDVPPEAWRTPAPPPVKEDTRLPPEVAALNHHYESCRLTAYPDPLSGDRPITIGWGSTFDLDGRPIPRGRTITQAEADALYDHNCYHKFWKKLEVSVPEWERLSDLQRAALCSFAYNNGAEFYGGPNHETITRNLREHDWRAVPGTLMLYRNRGTDVEVGLGRRRRAEGLVWTGIEPSAAIAQAEREIRSPADCARIQTHLQSNPPEMTAASPRPGPAAAAPLPPASRRLQDFLGTDTKYSMDAIAADRTLAHQIQTRLIALGLLDPPTGAFGPISAAALARFQDLMDCGEEGYLGAITAERLIETSIDELPRPPLDLSGNDLASRIIRYMQRKGYAIDCGPKEMNIVYVEGMNPDGSLNDDRPNQFNDLRLVIEFLHGRPRIAGCWEGTTEPGRHYTLNPMNSQGAARIRFGQYRAWRIGLHGLSSPHRALIQVAPIDVHRDANRDFLRTGDNVQRGLFAINQHAGYDHPRNDIRTASAGCLVGRTTRGHGEFLALIEQDPRYLASPFSTVHPGDPQERNHVFTTTVIAGDDLARECPA